MNARHVRLSPLVLYTSPLHAQQDGTGDRPGSSWPAVDAVLFSQGFVLWQRTRSELHFVLEGISRRPQASIPDCLLNVSVRPDASWLYVSFGDRRGLVSPAHAFEPTWVDVPTPLIDSMGGLSL